MSWARRIAVLGLYNSGSTGIAGMLHRLGVNMGPPFWMTSNDRAGTNYYEPYDLAWHLRRWWDEPRAVERVPAEDRIRFLSCWAALQETVRPGPVGAKHPLLSLCGDDLVTAWGPRTRFVWSWRPLDESIAGLQRRGWFVGHAVALQERLWNTLNDFASRRGDVIELDWTRVKTDPTWAAQELASIAGIALSEERLQSAVGFIRVQADSSDVETTHVNPSSR